MKSIAARLSVAASLVLAGFVLSTAIALQSSVHERAEQAQYDRLQGLVYGLLGATDVADDGSLQVAEAALPDGRLRQLNSGLYAAVVSPEITPIWRSPSLLAALPSLQIPAVGEWRFARLTSPEGELLLSALFTVEWAVSAEQQYRYTFAALRSASELADQLASFDRKLWLTLGLFSALLLAAQLAVLRWGLRPLRQLAGQIRAIEAGTASRLENPTHRELQPLSEGLNALLNSEQAQRSRYRDALDDLAHSLKTPLAVLRNLSTDAKLPPAERELLAEHTARMEQIVGYQLQRAGTRGQRVLSAPIALAPVVARLARSLEKVFADKHCCIEVRINADIKLRMDEGDLMELLGNIMENAAKYGRSRMSVSAPPESPEHADDIEILIEDDGPGFPDDRSELLARGARADSLNEGQGIGLAVATDILRSCGGTLHIEHSAHLGGGAVRLHIQR